LLLPLHPLLLLLRFFFEGRGWKGGRKKGRKEGRKERGFGGLMKCLFAVCYGGRGGEEE
jgi:hypothetical protein